MAWAAAIPAAANFLEKHRQQENTYLTGAGTWLAQRLGIIESPFKSAQPYMRQAEGDIGDYYNKATGFLSPYREAGKAALPSYFGSASQLSDPSNYYDKLMSTFKLSPAEQFAQKQGERAISGSAATHGLLGSPNMAKALQQYGTNMTGQAQQQYLQNLLRMKQQGMQGMGQLIGLGAGAASTSGGYAMQTGQEKAQLQEALAQMAAGGAKGDAGGIGSIISGALNA